MKSWMGLGLGALLGAGAAAGIVAAHGADDPSTYRQLDLFSTAFQKVRADYVEPVEDSKLMDSAIQGMVTSLDPHSSYMTAKAFNGDFQITTHGQFGGVGVVVQQDNGTIKVISATDGMPAAKAGIKPEDHITAIDNTVLNGKDFNDQVDKMKGPVGTKVTLTVERAGEKQPFKVTLTRAVIAVNATTFKREGDIGVIRMPGFNEHTAEGMEQAIKDLKKTGDVKGYVLDLRNNPGGLLDQAIQVSDDLLTSGEIVSTRGRRPDDTQRYDAKPGDITGGKPIVVLINGGTASASEIVAGALKDHKRATIVGMTSFGKGSVQTVLPLGEGRGALRLTTARYYTPSGHSIQALGITPDIQVAQGDEDAGPRILHYSEAELNGHLIGETREEHGVQPIVSAAPGKKYDDFQLSYALDLLRGTMTVASVTRAPSNGG